MSGPVTDAMVKVFLDTWYAGSRYDLHDDARAALEAAIAAMEQAAAPAAPPAEAPLLHGWRPIETCPAHVDRAILGGRYADGRAWVDRSYRRPDGRWHGHIADDAASHWQPDPSPETVPQPGQFETPLPEHAPAVIRRSMTPEESALLADAMRQGGKLEYLIPRDQSEFAILVRSGESNGAEDGRIVKMGRDLESLGVHAPAVDLGAGLRRALEILTHPNAGMEPPDGGDPSEMDRVRNVADQIRDEIAALAAERKGDGR